MRRMTVAAVLAAGLFAAACSSKPHTVVLGVGLATNAHPGIKLAAREINANGGIGGVPLELVGMDWSGLDQPYNPETILRWANRFAAVKDLLGVIGHNDSATTLTAAAIYNVNRIPHLVTIATNPSITNIGAWTYRLCLSDSAQGPALAEYAVKDWGKRRIAVFYVNDDYGRALTQLFEEQARKLGATILTSVMHRNVLEQDDKDQIKSALTEMKKGTTPDLVVLFQRVDAAIWTVGAMKEAGLSCDILGSDNLAQESFAAGVPKWAAGIRVSQFLRLDPSDPHAAKFAGDYRAFTGYDPNYAQGFAYDAVYLLKDAILSGRYTRAGVKSYFDRLIQDGTPIHGVCGTYTLGADHDARRSLYIVELRDGKMSFLKALPPQR